jgi:hypothetical protein
VPDLVEQIEARGAQVVPLPRYSPELNPIEHLWSQALDQEGMCRHSGGVDRGRGVGHTPGVCLRCRRLVFSLWVSSPT